MEKAIGRLVGHLVVVGGVGRITGLRIPHAGHAVVQQGVYLLVVVALQLHPFAQGRAEAFRLGGVQRLRDLPGLVLPLKVRPLALVVLLDFQQRADAFAEGLQ